MVCPSFDLYCSSTSVLTLLYLQNSRLLPSCQIGSIASIPQHKVAYSSFPLVSLAPSTHVWYHIPVHRMIRSISIGVFLSFIPPSPIHTFICDFLLLLLLLFSSLPFDSSKPVGGRVGGFPTRESVCERERERERNNNSMLLLGEETPIFFSQSTVSSQVTKFFTVSHAVFHRHGQIPSFIFFLCVRFVFRFHVTWRDVT